MRLIREAGQDVTSDAVRPRREMTTQSGKLLVRFAQFPSTVVILCIQIGSWPGDMLNSFFMGQALLDRITVNSQQCGGRPCVRGMRIRVTDVLGMLAEGVSEKEILQDYPYLEQEDIRACLLFASRATDHAVLTAA
jgi:uncharacterized protein (DUF433 family)